MSQPRILAFAGSTRRESFNKKLLHLGIQGAKGAGAAVTFVDLRDYPLPLFDEDLEAEHGLPQNAQTLKELFYEHEGLLISSPEYNSSVTAVLKNTIDWVSRPLQGEPGLKAYKGKVAALMSASTGGLGGIRGLVHLRSILGNIGVIVLPDQVTVPTAKEAFQGNGQLKDVKKQASVEKLGADLAQFLARLGPST